MPDIGQRYFLSFLLSFLIRIFFVVRPSPDILRLRLRTVVLNGPNPWKWDKNNRLRTEVYTDD